MQAMVHLIATDYIMMNRFVNRPHALLLSFLLLVTSLLSAQSESPRLWSPNEIGAAGFSLQPDDTLIYKTVELEGELVELRIQAFYPEGYQTNDQRPSLIFFHGGGWHSGTPDQFYPQCRYFALRGLVTFSVEYRTIKRFTNSPKECVADGKSAVRWIRQHAAELGVNPDQLAVGGGSAGGHIAAATAFTTEFNEVGEDLSISCKPNALLLYNPVFDNGPNGFAHGLVQSYWQDISPIDNIATNPPPSIVILGTEDIYLPVKTAQRYQTLIEAEQGICELHIYEGKEHGFFNIWVSRPDLAQTMVQVDRFLVSLGYLQGQPILKVSDL